MFLVPFQTKGWKIDHYVSNLRTRGFLFQGVQVKQRRKIEKQQDRQQEEVSVSAVALAEKINRGKFCCLVVYMFMFASKS